jgi:thiosulfate/3-mercaptopyruvate sulfurtransferase
MRVLQPIVRSLVGVFALVFLAGASALTVSPRDSLVVSAAWLAQHQSDPDLVVVHVGMKFDYDAQHIPGARFVSLDDISVSDRTGPGLMLEMPPVEDLRQHLAALGITDGSRVVVYVSRASVTQATRVVFTLDYAGLSNAASVLDGGMDAWTRDGHPVTSDVPPAHTGTLAPLKTRPIVVDAAFVLAHLQTPHFAVVDARDAVFYDGLQTAKPAGRPPNRTGHIAGAHSVPYTSITDDQLKLRPAEELEAIFMKAGVKPDDTIIGYCHIGQQATAMLFAARSLGHPVLLYDGSFEDWSRHADYPVDNPAQKGGGR